MIPICIRFGMEHRTLFFIRHVKRLLLTFCHVVTQKYVGKGQPYVSSIHSNFFLSLMSATLTLTILCAALNERLLDVAVRLTVRPADNVFQKSVLWSHQSSSSPGHHGGSCTPVRGRTGQHEAPANVSGVSVVHIPLPHPVMCGPGAPESRSPPY